MIIVAGVNSPFKRFYIVITIQLRCWCADGGSCTLPMRSPTTNPPTVVSSREFQTSADRWASAFLSTAYGTQTAPAAHSIYPPRQSSVMLPLDTLRQLQPSLQRFSPSRVAHPTTRQSAFTIHHGAHSDLTTPGQSTYSLRSTYFLTESTTWKSHRFIIIIKLYFSQRRLGKT